MKEVVQNAGGTGELVAQRWDGEPVRLRYRTFAVRTAGLPYMGSIIWPDDAGA